MKDKFKYILLFKKIRMISMSHSSTLKHVQVQTKGVWTQLPCKTQVRSEEVNSIHV